MMGFLPRKSATTAAQVFQATVIWFLLLGFFSLFGLFSSGFFQVFWVMLACSAALLTIGSLGISISLLAKTSTSAWVRRMERIRSYIADEPASYEYTRREGERS
jgi:hypothetical protein